MNKFRLGFIAAALAALPVSGALAADGDVSATIGLKLWENNWSSWITTRSLDTVWGDGTATTTNRVVNMESGNTDGWIPSFSVRYKDFMIGGSYFAKTKYSFNSGASRRLINTFTNGTIVSSSSGVTFPDVKREEYDLTAGYYVLPTLAIIGGYKEVDQWFSGDKYKYSGPIIGASASGPLTGGFSVYGTAALGPMKLTQPNGGSKLDADYRLGELGLAYSFGNLGAAGLKSLIGTVGYRSQVIVTKLDGGWSGLKARDTTEGFTIGVVGAF